MTTPDHHHHRHEQQQHLLSCMRSCALVDCTHSIVHQPVPSTEGSSLGSTSAPAHWPGAPPIVICPYRTYAVEGYFCISMSLGSNVE